MRILIIQTAFIGDVILATAVAEKLSQFHPDAKIDFLVRKGNEALLKGNPRINQVLVRDKKEGKIKSLFKTLFILRNNPYDLLINLHRYGSSGFITAFSKAKKKIGFDKNPFSFFYDKKFSHEIGNGKHEVERNHLLITEMTDENHALPKLYPSEKNFESIKDFQSEPYVCIAPTSVWFTKQFPLEKWLELIQLIPYKIFLLGGSEDQDICKKIKSLSGGKRITNLSGKLSFLESAALIKGAKMNYVNDSAPLHMASAMNAPTTAIFCSTVPAFGFGPLADNARIVENKEKLACRPCGLHGHRQCPEKHFRCALTIAVDAVIAN